MGTPSLSNKPRVFITYARIDGEEFATRLRMRLEREEPEINFWQDRALHRTLAGVSDRLKA